VELVYWVNWKLF